MFVGGVLRGEAVETALIDDVIVTGGLRRSQQVGSHAR